MLGVLGGYDYLHSRNGWLECSVQCKSSCLSIDLVSAGRQTSSESNKVQVDLHDHDDIEFRWQTY